MLKSWKISKGSFYIRRRDKLLCEVTLVERMNVSYIVKKTGVTFKVSFDGFKQGFRPAKPEEVPNEMAPAPATGEPGE